VTVQVEAEVVQVMLFVVSAHTEKRDNWAADKNGRRRQHEFWTVNCNYQCKGSDGFKVSKIDLRTSSGVAFRFDFPLQQSAIALNLALCNALSNHGLARCSLGAEANILSPLKNLKRCLVEFDQEAHIDIDIDDTTPQPQIPLSLFPP
jgi:hypothetical protein